MRTNGPKKSLLAEIKYVMDLYERVETTPNIYAMGPNEPQRLITAFVIAAQAAIQRATGLESVYSRQANQYAEGLLSHPYFALEESGMLSLLKPLSPDARTNLARLVGVVQVVQRAIMGDYLVSVEESIHAQVFTDFLEMAEHLRETGYKDPAAVIAGSVLEQHLRKLCLKSNLPIESTGSAGKTRSKNGESLNTDLAANKVYGRNEQKQVTAWLGIRNSAAHGKYSEYSGEQVDLLIRGVRGFLARYLA